MELISMKDISADSKIQLLKELGYDSDGEFIINSDGSKLLDRYLEIHLI